MNPGSPYSLHIVVGFDFSPLAELALREAAVTASRSLASAVHVVTVVEAKDPAYSAPGTMAAHIKERIAAVLRQVSSTADVHIFAHVLAGDPAGEILSLAEDVEADLIVIGTHGRRGVKRLLMGSVAEKVMREAACPVTVMRPRRYEPHPDLVPEPSCPECVKVRAATGGAGWWCANHEKPWVQPHRYTYRDGMLRPFHPDGIGPS